MSPRQEERKLPPRLKWDFSMNFKNLKFDYIKAIHDCSDRLIKKYKIDNLEVPPGWGDLVDQVLLQVYVLDPNIYISQIKEKFGGLRIYYVTESKKEKELEKVVSEAEKKSYEVCQICGKPGRPAKFGSWTMTVCDYHLEKISQP